MVYSSKLVIFDVCNLDFPNGFQCLSWFDSLILQARPLLLSWKLSHCCLQLWAFSSTQNSFWHSKTQPISPFHRFFHNFFPVILNESKLIRSKFSQTCFFAIIKIEHILSKNSIMLKSLPFFVYLHWCSRLVSPNYGFVSFSWDG